MLKFNKLNNDTAHSLAHVAEKIQDKSHEGGRRKRDQQRGEGDPSAAATYSPTQDGARSKNENR